MAPSAYERDNAAKLRMNRIIGGIHVPDEPQIPFLREVARDKQLNALDEQLSALEQHH